jgi:membrane protein implicated in regulation of membrane protease activity
MWKKIRSSVMFVIACIASPCCTPLIVPIGLALLAGTPVAVWASANLGWVYGGLTLLSVISLVLGLRWMGQRSEARHKVTKQTVQGNTHS